MCSGQPWSTQPLGLLLSVLVGYGEEVLRRTLVAGR